MTEGAVTAQIVVADTAAGSAATVRTSRSPGSPGSAGSEGWSLPAAQLGEGGDDRVEVGGIRHASNLHAT